MNKKLRSALNCITAAVMVLSCIPSQVVCISAADSSVVQSEAGETYSSYQLRAQLKSPVELKIYDLLTSMAENGDFIRGTARVPLDVDEELIKAYAEGDAALIQYFQNARDAFAYDRSDIFYVDWSKLSLRACFDESGNYSAFIGNGAYRDMYLDNGYNDEDSIRAAISQIESAADEIISEAKKLGSQVDQLRYVHDTIIKKGTYLDPGDFSTFHGSNVCGILLHGEAWCEGYSRAFHYIVQRMGYECVLVLGGAVPKYASNGDTLFEPTVQEHMWNYVMLSNGKWYAVDVTYDDPTVITAEGKKNTLSDAFFLKGSDNFMANHVEYGQLSQGGKAFSYPTLSKDDFGVNSGTELVFRLEYHDYPDWSYSMTSMYPTFIDENGKELYGKAIVDSGYYLAGRNVLMDKDGNVRTDSWKDFSKTAFDYTDPNCIYGFAVNDTTKGELLIAYDFAIVRNAPDGGQFAATSWNGDMDIITVSDRVYLRDMYVDPRASSIRMIYKDPSSIAPMKERVKKVTLRFDAPLELIDPKKPAMLTVDPDISGADFRIENMLWENIDLPDMGDLAKGSQVTFDFYPDQSFNYSGTNYKFTLGNLKSKLDESVPQPFTIQCAVPLPSVIPCVRTPSPSQLTVPIQPTLVKNSFNADMFTDPSGNLIKNSGSLNISLIASKPTAGEQAELNKALDMPNAIESATFDLSLSCSAMRTALKYHSAHGTKVTLALPYPNGFDSRKLSGVTFEAYHFTKNPDGSYSKEKLVCNATETGIFVIADSFSPFTVVAIPESDHVSDGGRCLSVINDVKMASVSAVDENGDPLDPSLIRLTEGGSCTINFTPADGYVMEQLILNGEPVEIPEELEVTFSYDDLAENNSIIARFCAEDVAEQENISGVRSAEPTGFAPDMCVNNDQPVINAPESAVTSDFKAVSAEPVVMEMPEENTVGTPVTSTAATTTTTKPTTTTTTSTTTTTKLTTTTTTSTTTTTKPTTTTTTSTTTTTKPTTTTTTSTTTTTKLTTTTTTSTTTTTKATTTTTTSTTTTTKATTTTTTSTTTTTKPTTTTTTSTTTTTKPTTTTTTSTTTTTKPTTTTTTSTTTTKPTTTTTTSTTTTTKPTTTTTTSTTTTTKPTTTTTTSTTTTTKATTTTTTSTTTITTTTITTEVVTTTDAPVSSTTVPVTSTTAVTTELPETGYSKLYDVITAAAAMMTLLGFAAVRRSKKTD